MKESENLNHLASRCRNGVVYEVTVYHSPYGCTEEVVVCFDPCGTAMMLVKLRRQTDFVKPLRQHLSDHCYTS
ncbi:hypothetical protein NECAME_03809 [Necator americanus]|uniref:Uncharacterized protein n=1 Tax=Necator americanus TaxID=51031 RepID=W2T1F9_NECAM|nr:hypothetical protein NECAME_03809 [Necator americanus]ETN75086.1 hypothetical protein NECAME_03809 [Necator americanus]